MKAAFLTASLSRKSGGFFETVRRLGQALQGAEGVDLRVFTVRDEHTEEDLRHVRGLEVRLFSRRGPAAFGYAPGLAGAVADFAPDLAHTHGIWMYPSVAALHWAKSTGRPYVITPQGMLDAWALRHSRWKKRLAGWAYENAHLRRAGCLQAVCQPELEAMRACGLRNPICLIPNGIDLPEAPPAGQPPWQGQIPPGAKVLLYLGRFHTKKNLCRLIEAWSRLGGMSLSAADQWRLVFAGRDSGDGYEQEMKKTVEATGCGGSVLFVGPQYFEANALCYHHAQAFVLPSLSEGQPMAVLTAWAHGRPVLMTPECFLPEGFSARAALRIQGTAEGIAEGLRALVEAPAQDLKEMGERGRTLAQTRFSWASVAREMKSVYQWLLGGGAAPACVHRN
jgi:glycosyltransferase involved in cell wall biosynthesis